MPSVAEFKQLSLEAMQHGLAKTIARVRLEPSQIAERSGIDFHAAQDDLDDVDVALISTPSGKQLALARHRHQPSGGTDIITNERSTDPTADLLEVMRVLALTPFDLSWKHPDIDSFKVWSHSLEQLLSKLRSAVRPKRERNYSVVHKQ